MSEPLLSPVDHPSDDEMHELMSVWRVLGPDAERGAGYGPSMVRGGPELLEALYQELHVLAAWEEAQAIREAAGTPYWARLPRAAEAHQLAARALRTRAAELEEEAVRRAKAG